MEKGRGGCGGAGLLLGPLPSQRIQDGLDSLWRAGRASAYQPVSSLPSPQVCPPLSPARSGEQDPWPAGPSWPGLWPMSSPTRSRGWNVRSRTHAVKSWGACSPAPSTPKAGVMWPTSKRLVGSLEPMFEFSFWGGLLFPVLCVS